MEKSAIGLSAAGDTNLGFHNVDAGGLQGVPLFARGKTCPFMT